MISPDSDNAFEERFARWMDEREPGPDDEVCLRLLFRCPRCGTTLQLIDLDHWERGRELVAACFPCNVIEGHADWVVRRSASWNLP